MTNKTRMVDVVDWIRYLLSKALIPCLLVIAVVALSFLVGQAKGNHSYTATTAVLFSVDRTKTKDEKTLIEGRDHKAFPSESLLEYVKMMTVKDQVARSLGFKDFVDLKDKVSGVEFEEIAKRRLLILRVEGQDPDLLIDFSQAYLQEIEEIVASHYNLLNLEVVDEPNLIKASPSVKTQLKRPLIWGLLVGGLGFVTYSAIYFLDGKVRSRAELTYLLDVKDVIELREK